MENDETTARVQALRARRAARGMADPLNRMRAGMAASDAPRVIEQPAPHVLEWLAEQNAKD